MSAFRWARTHAITLLGTAVVLTGIVLAQTGRSGSWTYWTSFSTTSEYSHGWPIVALRRSVHEGRGSGGTWQITSEHHHWQAPGLLVDGFVCLLLLASTATCCERIRKRRLKPYQFRLSDALAAAVVLSLLLSFHLHEFLFYRWYADLTGDTASLYHRFWALRPWYVRLPIYLGMACFILLVFRLITFCASRIAMRTDNRRA